MATIKDIANAAGVSPMTVSRFFNNPEKLNANTYDTIKNVVDEIGYKPNQIARSLAKRRTNIICVYTSCSVEMIHPYTSHTMIGIGEELGKYGYSMLMTKDKYDVNNCDGIIAMGISEDQEEELLEISKEKPVVLYGSESGKNNGVTINNYSGSFIATEYMIKRGYKKIGNIGLSGHSKFFNERARGYFDCMQQYKMAIPKDGAIRVGNNEDEGYYAAKRMVEYSGVDAIVCASDHVAFGVVRYAKENNIKIPEELGVIGFDGFGYENMTTPGITTMRQPVYDAGKALAGMMVDALDCGEHNKGEVLIDPILIPNGTTK